MSDLARVLSELVVPPVVPVDDPPRGVRGEAALSRGMVYYDPMGHPIPGPIDDQFRLVDRYCEDEANRFKTSMWFDGVPLEVSTVYLRGIDHQCGDQPYPLVWETMVFAGLDMSGEACWRYAHRPAALLGHRAVVGVLLDAGTVLAGGTEMGGIHE
jgi:hypothetical protein